jgi:hypothetical protein
MRLSERQIYLAVWLVALAAVIGIAAGIIALKLLARPTPPTLIGDIVMAPPFAAPGFTCRTRTAQPSPCPSSREGWSR